MNKGKSILVVDDVKEVRNIIKKELEFAGFQVLEATSTEAEEIF